MAVERKQMQAKPEKKKNNDQSGHRKLRRGFKVETLPDAIVDGKCIAPLESELVVERFRNGKNMLCICTVKQLDESGLIHTWDETLQQWFVFPASEAPKTTKLFSSKD